MSTNLISFLHAALFTFLIKPKPRNKFLGQGEPFPFPFAIVIVILSIVICQIPKSMSKTQILAPPTLVLLIISIISISSTEAAPSFDWVQEEFLKAHNDLRSSVGVPPLEWDAKLAAFAYDWATLRKQDCNYRQHSTGPYGEKIFWELYRQNTATSVVQKWFSEKQFFDHEKNVCKCQPEKAGCECGHYLNVIWKTTTKVGCSGFVYCNDQKGVYIVCSYDPIGNYKGVNPLNPGNSTSSVAPSPNPDNSDSGVETSNSGN